MNTRIEDSIVYGLVRIFSEYGWPEGEVPQLFTNKVKAIRHGLYHGEAKSYINRISEIISARRKDHNWGPLYEPTYVIGIKNLLRSYVAQNHLLDARHVKQPKYDDTLSSENIFRAEEVGCEALQRLMFYNKTNIRYNIVEQYGVSRLTSDLQEIYPLGSVLVNYSDHIPDQIRDWEYDDGKEKMTVFFPIMPLVILSTGLDD